MRSYIKVSYEELHEHGANAAVLLGYLRGWLDSENKRVEVDQGQRWIQISNDEILAKLTHMGRRTLSTLVNKLVDAGALLVADRSKNRYARINSYALPARNNSAHVSAEDENNNGHDVKDCTHVHAKTAQTTSNRNFIKNNKNNKGKPDIFLTENPDFKFSDDIRTVLAFWASTMNIKGDWQKASKTNENRARLVSDALGEGYTLQDCLDAVEGAFGNDWLMGRTPSNKNVYNELRYILNLDKIERHIGAKRRTDEESSPKQWFDKLNAAIDKSSKSRCEIDITPKPNQFDWINHHACQE